MLLEGPDWTEPEMLTGSGGMYPHIARCYAALCLGAIKDSRAFEPLVQTLQHGDYLGGKYTITNPEKKDHDIRSYAAIALGLLGDQRAVDPLIEQLPKTGNVHIAYSLARLGDIKAIPPIIEYGFRYDPTAHREIHRCLEELTGTRVQFEFDRNYRCTDPMFPELGWMSKAEVYKRHWQYWQAGNGYRYAKEQFEPYYPEWRRSLKQSLLQKMLAGRVVVMPELMDKLEAEGEVILPAIDRLVGRFIKPPNQALTRSMVNNWWNRNKHKWSELVVGGLNSLGTVGL
ncbi:MAG: hypothetical protein QHH07_08540 [Sedimentisphaerales bacterium]|nr:hypothetical protein [Sedimentisphaerales bacterium]